MLRSILVPTTRRFCGRKGIPLQKRCRNNEESRLSAITSPYFARCIRTSSQRIQRQQKRKRIRNAVGEDAMSGNVTKGVLVPKAKFRSEKNRRNRMIAMSRVAARNPKANRLRRDVKQLRGSIRKLRWNIRMRQAKDIVKTSLERPKPATFNLALLGHTSNLLYLGAFCVNDIIGLRSLSVVGGCFSVAFNYLQPSTLWVPVVWGCVFVGLNIYFIADNLLQGRVSFSDSELQIYERYFQPHNISVRQFRKIFELCEVVSFLKGETITHQGAPLTHMYMVVEGEVEQKIDDLSHGSSVPGMLIGNAPISQQTPDNYVMTTTARTAEVVALAWRVDEVRKMTMEKSKLQLPIMSLLNDQASIDIVQMNDAMRKSNHLTYELMVRTAFAATFVTPEMRKELAEFRDRNKISDLDHEDVLGKIGWAVEDFESKGVREVTLSLFSGASSRLG